jgi:hypothetical protein
MSPNAMMFIGIASFKWVLRQCIDDCNDACWLAKLFVAGSQNGGERPVEWILAVRTIHQTNL